MSKPTWNPLRWWRDWWFALSTVEQLAVVFIFIAAITLVLLSPAWAQANPGSERTSLVAVIFSGVTGLLTAAGVIYNIYLTNQSRDEIKQNTSLTHNLAVSVDGRLSQLLEKTERAATAEGVAQGRADVHTEIKEAEASKQ